MRVRKRKWVDPFMQNDNAYLIKTNDTLKKEAKKYKNIYLEIGAGHGDFIIATALQNQENLYIALEKDMVCSARAIKKAQELNVKNLFFINEYIEKCSEIFGNIKFDGIYLQFSDPWPKKRHAERRLTHIKKLEVYYDLLKENGFLYFKTDNEQLFRFSIEQLNESKFTITEICEDYHKEHKSGIMTAYESKFVSMSKQIYYAFCRKE